MNVSISVGESDGGLLVAYIDCTASGLFPLTDPSVGDLSGLVLLQSGELDVAKSVFFVALSLPVSAGVSWLSDGARELSCVDKGVTGLLSTTGIFCSNSY